MRQALKKHAFPRILCAVVILIAFLTYKPGTFLSGWDTLHPEFDFPLNFKRLILGVWRGEQGLGAVAGHSHMADLPRVFILWASHFVVPLNTLRYLYLFLCLLLGPFGMYYLCVYLGKNVILGRSEATTPESADSGQVPRLRSGQARMTKKQTSFLVAFLTALFYLLNLSTLQQFYTPFEMFPTQYAFLPWIMLYSIKFLGEGGKKNLTLFALFTLFATPQAYAAHLWYAFFGVYVLFLLLYLILNKTQSAKLKGQKGKEELETGPAAVSFPPVLATLRAVGNPSDRVTRFQLSASLKTPSLKRSFALIALTLMINAFWLLPNLYFIATAGSVPRESKQNRIFSQEYRLRNREHGYLKDVALLKGFYFNWTAYNFDKERVEYLMPTWRAHLAGKGVSAVGYVVFAFVVFGIALSFFRKNRLHLSFLPFFAVPFVFLMNHTFPFDRFFDYLAQLPLFEEGLRFVFTKFSILIVFSYAIFLSFFLFELFARIRKAAAVYLSAGVFIVLLVYFMSPLFQGHLISDKFKVKIPNDYFALWDFMKKQDDGIVLSLPLHTLSGWQYYNWGYQGAGFIWFGLKQPVLDRDFDRWSVPNEQAFRELQYGLYTRKPELFLTALKKYDVSYLLWDKENIAPTTKNRRQIVYEREIEELLTKLLAEKLIAKIAQFGDLIIYKHIYDIPRTAIKKITRSVSPPYRWNYVDFAYAKGGDYYVAPGRNYPFRNILELNDRIKKELLEIDPGTNSYFLHAKTDNFYNFTSVPSITASEEVLFADLYVQKLPYTDSVRLIFKFVLPKGLVQNSIYETSLQTGQTNRKLSVNGQEYLFDSQVLYDNVPVYVGQTFLYTKGKNFINGKEGSLQFDEEKQITKAGALFSKFPLAKIVYNPNRLYEFANNKRSVKLEKRKVVFSTENYQAGVSMTLETLPHDTGYIVMFRSRNKEGLPLRICLKNLYSNLCSLYDELSGSQDFIEDYFVIPPLEDGIGYSLSIDNISYGDYSSINELEEVAIIPFPYNFLSQIYSEGAAESAYQKEIFVLNQSYNLGWKAYANGKELKNHVLVNNWANGWILDPSTIQQYNNMTIRLVFLPQYLEFLGFGLLTIVFMALLWYTMGHETSARFS